VGRARDPYAGGWGGTIPSQVFLDEARRIVEEGEKEGLSYSRKPVPWPTSIRTVPSPRPDKYRGRPTGSLACYVPGQACQDRPFGVTLSQR